MLKINGQVTNDSRVEDETPDWEWGWEAKIGCRLVSWMSGDAQGWEAPGI